MCDALLVEQQLHRLHELLVDGVQQCVLHLDAGVNQQLNHLQVLIVDGHQQATPAQGVAAVDVQLLGA